MLNENQLIDKIKSYNNFVDINLRDSKKYSSIHYSRIYNGFLRDFIK